MIQFMSQHPAPESKSSIFENNDQYLVESRDGIVHLLNSMVLSSTPCAAYLEETEEFIVCSILGLDIQQSVAYLRYDAETPLLDTLLESKSVRYIASHEDSKIQFLSSQPHTVTFRNQPALRIPIPKLLWRMQRREHPRRAVAPGQVKVILNFTGIGYVEAEAADISIAGVGIIHYHPQLKLEEGLVLDDCEIRIPGEANIKVKLRIQHSIPLQFPDGEIIKRSGCQFIDLNQAASKALATYLNKLKKTD